MCLNVWILHKHPTQSPLASHSTYLIVLPKLMWSNLYLKLWLLKIEQMLSSKMSEPSIAMPGIKIKMVY